MKKKASECRITLCSLVIPYYDKRAGRFYNWYETDQPHTFSGTPSFINPQFPSNKTTPRKTTYLLDTDRSKFDYAEYSANLSKMNQDFVRFAIAEDDPSNIWELVISPNKLNEIWANSQEGAHIQLFDLTFNQAIQMDPNISITLKEELNSGLMVHANSKAVLGIGLIDDHRSMTLSDYQQTTGQDAVMNFAREQYYDPFYYDDYRKKWTFNDFLQRERRRFCLQELVQ